MKRVEVLHCSYHGPKPNSGEQQEKEWLTKKGEAKEEEMEYLLEQRQQLQQQY